MVDALSKGAGIIDGLIVGNFYTSDSLAAVGLASPMFDVERYIAKKWPHQRMRQRPGSV